MIEPTNRFSPARSTPQVVPICRALSVLILVSSAALTVLRYWVFSDPYPPGLDGAQWLSYGQALFDGDARGADSTYAPVVPALAHGFNLAFGPFLGLRVLAALLLVFLAFAVSLLSVTVLGWSWGALATALILPSTAMAEPYFYGGFPQQTALALGLLGIACILKAGETAQTSRQIRSFAAAAICLSLASASHLLFGPLLLSSAGVAVLTLGIARDDRRHYLMRAATTLTPAAAISALIALSYLQRGYVAPLAASQRSFAEAWVYATRESPWLWAVIVTFGILSTAFVVLKNHARSQVSGLSTALPTGFVVGTALLVPSALLMVASGQPRLAPAILTGGTLLLAYAFLGLTRTWKRVRPAILTAWCLAIFWIAGCTTLATREFAQFYQVLDESLIAATRSILSAGGGSIAVAADHRGWPIGWWVEALQDQPVLTGSDTRWLAYPEEQMRADSVTELLASPNGSTLRQRAYELDVSYLILRKRDWIGWDRWLATPDDAPALVFDDDETMVLNVRSRRP